MDATQIFIVLVVIGLLLMGIEIFVPGGVLGVMGGMALIGAVLTGFVAFGPRQGFLAALMILVFLAVSILLWIKLIPNSAIGRSLTLETSTKDYKSTKESLRELMGKEGVAVTPLSPSGVARIDHHRVDVVADGSWIDSGARIRVVNVVGTHIAVRPAESPRPEQPA